MFGKLLANCARFRSLNPLVRDSSSPSAWGFSQQDQLVLASVGRYAAAWKAAA